MTYQPSWDRAPGTPYWGTATHFRVPIKVIKEIRDWLSQGQVISAIKTLVAATGCGLAEAKAATERLSGKTSEGPRILPLIKIKSITLDAGDGELTVDLEGLQLMGLMQLQSLGLDECRHILGLVDRLNEWQGATDVTSNPNTKE